MFLIIIRVGKVPERLENFRMISMSKARRVTNAAVVHLDEPVPLHPGNVSKDADDTNREHVEEIWDQQDLSN